MTDEPTSPSDDFDRIVEGLDLDLSGLEDFDAAAERAAAARAAAERERIERLRREALERESAPTPEERAYREVGPAGLHAAGAKRWAWLVVVGGPAVLVLCAIASWRPPTAIVLAIIAAVVGAVVYLIAQLPDHGPSNPDWPDDGAAL